MDLKGFGRKMTIRADHLPEAVNRIVKLVALAVDQTIVLATPVDTGAARSNWVVSVDSPKSGIIDPYSPIEQGTDPSKIGESANASRALDQGKGVIQARPPGHNLYITNNLDYIEDLNNGKSAQAPASFVQLAIQQGIAAVKGAKLDTGKK
ncbi:MAG: hypothetical protein KAR40_06040 [Candidatus Sabulitectum sp.]|nr:hypothetical protein [Candidatus Sabulitectum sp.]